MATSERALPAVVPQASGIIMPAGTIEEALEAFRAYQDLKARMADRDDFQEIQGRLHPKKSFVRKVQRFFNLSCEILRDEAVRDADGEIIAWVATARAIHLPTGTFQDGDGSCSMSEKAEKQRTIHNIRAHAITRAKNRAILDLVGFGEVSADEIGEGDDTAAGRRAAASRPARRGDGPATEKQVKMLYALQHRLRDAGWADDDIRRLMVARFGERRAKDLSMSEASEAIEILQQALDESAPPEGEDGA
ncbi:MAG: hypothetical protein QJR08_03870 [Bacillota bacterium]|nr:hypothetical protein [Bacillota bacterium]